jgi:UDP-glucose 4-epimerase
MRVLVTGGAGYIGSAMTEALVLAGHDVTVYDNLSRGHRDAVISDAAFVEGDLLDAETLRGTLTRQRVEAVIHMAGVALVGESMKEPALYYRTNVTGGLTLLEAMREAGTKSIVFSSTCAVYGMPATVPIEETTSTNPVNPYGESKLAFERALHWYHDAHGFRAISLRYFNAAGATERCGERHDPETHLIPLVIDVAAGSRSELTIFGDDYPTRDGTCVRDYIHILDLAQAHILALEALERGDAPNDAYNLGCGGEGHTIREVIDCARRVTGREIPARVGPRRDGDPPVLVASSASIARELGWQPKHQRLEEIIESAWKWKLTRGAGSRGLGVGSRD